MNDNLPDVFARLTPRPAPPELRPRVLAAVERELRRQSAPRWERIFELTVAAALLLGIGLNVWLIRAEEAWQTRVYGPQAVPRALDDLAQSVASVTDQATGKWVREQFSSAWRHRRREEAPHGSTYEWLLSALKPDKVGAT